MRYIGFLAIIGALAVAAFAEVDLSAGCRCNKGARKAARQERRACRRAFSYAAPAQPTNYVSPYPDQVQPVGAVAGESEVVWQCMFDHKGRKIGCKPVRVPVANNPAPKPAPDPISKVESLSPSKASETPTAIDEADFGETGAFNEQPGDAPPWLRQLQASETDGLSLSESDDLTEPKASAISEVPDLVAEHLTSDPPEAP